MIFEFTCNINPPTKNEKQSISVYSKRAGRRVPMTSPAYTQQWELMHNLMYQKKFGISKPAFKLLAPKDRAKLEKGLTDKNVILSMWNGFHRMDTSAFLHEIEDRLQGIAYKNDRQIKQVNIFKDDDCKTEYFKIIVEEL